MSRDVSLAPSLHDSVETRLAGLDQRYTRQRRVLVETLSRSARPLTIPEILSASPELPQSSAYRNITALVDAGVVRRIVGGADDHGRLELAEEFSGHHHHLVCSSCGRVEDVPPSQRLERALGDTVKTVGDHGYVITDHRVELLGICPDCVSS